MKKILSSLPGIKHLIRGNHDTASTEEYIRAGFDTVYTFCTISLPGLSAPLTLVHDPAFSQMDRSQQYLCGHVHDLFRVQKNVINVGVDVWNFCPVSSVEIKEIIKRKNEI
jgi:calcineurin-like phosphoesterase family protein